MVASIILMVLPYGVRMQFAAPPGEGPFVFYYSYFSGIPLGYANWLPIITALLSIAILLLLIIGYKKDLKQATLICLFICIAASVLSWIIFRVFTVIGVIVFALHIITLALQFFTKNKKAE